LIKGGYLAYNYFVSARGAVKAEIIPFEPDLDNTSVGSGELKSSSERCLEGRIRCRVRPFLLAKSVIADRDSIPVKTTAV
jgi:hypothetical protein